MDKILTRELAQLDYFDPEVLGREIMSIVVGILFLPESVAHLSQRQKNLYLEKYQAVFLAILVKHFSRRRATVTVAIKELQDFDCVIRAVIDSQTPIYRTVQLKHLSNMTRKDSLQEIINKIKSRFTTSSDLTVAIWINRDIELQFDKLDFNGLNIAQLWLFGSSTDERITLDGGIVSDLISGLRFAASVKDGKLEVRPEKFKPLSKTICYTTLI